MNCAEFRRRLLEDPASRDPEWLAHADACRQCREARQAALEFEARLREALQVPLPRKTGEARPVVAPTGRRRLVAAGAGLVLAILLFAGVGMVWRQGQAVDLPRLVVQHIRSEAELLTLGKPMDTMQVAAVMEGQGYTMRRLPVAVVAALPCWIRTGRGVHLVLQGDDGPVTVLIMPGEPLEDAEPLRQGGMEGLLMPAARGSVAVVAASSEDLQESIAYLRENLTWGGQPAVYRF